MIQAAFYYGADETSMTLTGHSEMNPGNDIVCAAASFAFQQLLFWILDKDIRSVRFCNRSGNGTVATTNQGFVPLYQFTENGLRSLASSYPEYISVVVTAAE